MPESLDVRLKKFADFASKLRGDEKGEAQVFLDHLFRAMGHEELVIAGVELEKRIKFPNKATKFADLVWPGRVLIEMKKRGERLEKHYRQAFDYWVYLVPDRPRFVLLCNFDELWVYDFNLQVEEPMETVRVVDIAKRASALSFLKPQLEEPVFGLNRIQVTKDAADKVATVFNSMVARGIGSEAAQRFILQCVVAKFSEDLNLLPRDLFSRILQESLQSSNPSSMAFDLIFALFRQMNSPERATGGRYRDVRYFNGGLFAIIHPFEATRGELEGLYEAATQDWSKVNPAIFGTLFQHSMGKETRHAYGAHYTSESDILKVVSPTIVRPWQERFDAARSLDELISIRADLLRYRVLDPACGSGNFLYIAFRELKRFETELILEIRNRFKGKKAQQKAKGISQGYLSVRQFFGFDTLDFAVELAKVTLLLAKEIGIAETEVALRGDVQTIAMDLDPALPLENLDQNIQRLDSLMSPWPEVHAIIGNPPYQSKNKMQEEYGRKYLNELRAQFPNVSGMADYCVYFFRKAHDALPIGGRAGLVGTNTIRENYSREGGLDYIVATGGTIVEAISSQAWSGDAAVHVSIVNWVKGDCEGSKKLLNQAEDGTWTIVDLEKINSSLSNRVDVAGAKRLRSSSEGIKCAQGQTHGHEGFLLQAEVGKDLLLRHPILREILFPYLNADELLANLGSQPSRFVIDFGERDVFQASNYEPVFSMVKEKVLPDRKTAAAKEAARNEEARKDNPKAKVNRHHANFLARWWALSYGRSELMAMLRQMKRFIACSRVTKRPIFEFVSTNIHPSDVIVVFPFEDDYSFGILQSSVHWTWFVARCSTLEERFRYTSDTVFDSFPWPQHPTEKAVVGVAGAARALRAVRNRLMAENGYSLRDLYRLAEQPGKNALKDAAEKLDEAVYAAYGMKSSDNALAFLLALNAECAELEGAGKSVQGPGLPKGFSKKAEVMSEDCVRVVI